MRWTSMLQRLTRQSSRGVKRCALIAAAAVGSLALPSTALASFPGNNGKIAFMRNYDVYTINADGTLTAVANSQVKTASTSANTVATNFDPTGSFLAVAGDGGVQTFAINANGTPAAVASPQSAGANFQNVAWDNSNHVFAANSSQLYVFNSSTGVLTPASGSPHAGGPELTVFSTK